MKIIGYKRSDFTPPNGTLVTGYNVFLTYPVSGEDADGVTCERVYLSDAKLAKSGYKLHVGDEVRISYNRYGKPDTVVVVK